MYLENSLVMYGAYNVETLENTVHNMQNSNTEIKRLFAELNAAFTWYINTPITQE